MKTYSLQRSSLANFILALLITMIVTMGAAVWSANHEISKLYDAQLSSFANTLLLLSKHEAVEGEDINTTLGMNAAEFEDPSKPENIYRVWANDNLITQSPSGPIIGAKSDTAGYSNKIIDGKVLRLYTLVDGDLDVTIEVAQSAASRTVLVWKILWSLALPLSILIPFLIGIIFLGTRRIMAPLDRLSRDLDRRDANDLRSVQAHRLPDEVKPIFVAMNNLFSRLSESIRHEREFTDNAAHELRTPLAALKTRAQVMSKQAIGEPDLKESIDDMLVITNRTATIVEQLLSFTRLQQDMQAIEPVNLSRLLEAELAELATIAVRKNQNLEADIDADLCISGHAGAVSILIRNLIDNAIRYTPSGSDIHVGLSQDPNSVTLQISDTGPGLSAADKARVFERFTRINTLETGSGLGLSIVKWICDAHGADIALSDNQPNGLTVSVKFHNQNRV